MADRLIQAFVGVGSNIEPRRNIQAALVRLARRVRVTGVSTFYRTPALDRPDQPAFLNGVWRIETDLAPRALKLDVLRGIERSLGRVRTADRYAPRTIDLDLLLYGDLTVDEPDLRIPDPDIRKRPFIVVPLLELAPDLVMPDTGLPPARVARDPMPPGAGEALDADPDFTKVLQSKVRIMNEERVAELVRQLLIEIGENPEREGLLRTPIRVAKSMAFLTRGYSMSPRDIINEAIFESHANNMIIARDIEVYSLCEHHMLPFYGRCHIGYIAKRKVLGISKLARIVECFARRLQIQERLTAQIAKEIMESVDAQGVGVVMECRHLCMIMRGVEKQNSVMTTSSVLGSFLDDVATRTEFLNLISRPLA